MRRVVALSPLRLKVLSKLWGLAEPFRTTAHTLHEVELVQVQLSLGDHVGEGEAAGVYYRNDTPARAVEQIEAQRLQIERGIDRRALQHIFPPGGARNALDCALWDLESKVSGKPAWQLANLPKPRPLLTTFTCGADTPERMAARALSYRGARALKLKLMGDTIDAERVRAVRATSPDAWLAVDANQGFTRGSLEQLMPTLLHAKVALIEQPFPAGEEHLLEGFSSAIPIAADESVQTLADIPGLVGRFQVVNIKLDKCGGLTDALRMAHLCRKLGLEPMVGNMLGTSLAMAPGFLVGQLCSVVDLDGPVYLKQDRADVVRYVEGQLACSAMRWGMPRV